MTESERERWTAALADVAARLRAERGLQDRWSVTSEYGRLCANYGVLRVSVDGENPDVRDPAELLEDIDTWVAVEREGGPGRVLERDREFIASWRAQLPVAQRLWEEAARLVFADVEATTAVRMDWRVSVHEDEEVWTGPPLGDSSGAYFSVLELRVDDGPPPTEANPAVGPA